jgi:signal transduction histidine kinase/CheY-like chemotaxis protein
MDPKWAPYGLMAELLDSLNIAVCLFDDGDCTVLWNRTFLRLFPEQDGRLQAGEHYSGNLQRFYRVRLGPEELPNIDQYVRDGVARHRAQSRPFVFEHRGKWLRVGSQPLPGGGRIRIWTTISAPNVDAGMARALTGAASISDSAIMENVADGVMLLNADGRIGQINDQCLLLYGLGREQAVGLQYEELLAAAWIAQSPFPTPSGTREHWTLKLAEHRRFTGAPFEVLLPRDVWLRVIEQRGPDGVAYSTHVDISELKRQQRAISLAREAADRANAAKSAFLAMISHEIRTPMNGIIGMTHLLLDSGLDDRQRFYAETVETSAGTLLGIIDDVLDVSKLEAGKLTLEAIPFDPCDLVDEAIRLMTPRARERNLGLDRVRPSDAIGRRLGDPTRVRQVLLNLISNALKFTEAGGVTIEVETAPQDAGAITIKVSDTGIGLDPTAIGKLFQRFEQADGTITRRFGGTGLGLHISRQLVDLMGGEIGAEPRAEGGSLFWFTLPLAPAPADVAPVAAIEPEPARRSGGRVLVVEDNPINQLVAQAILSQAGFTVEIASGGQAALDMIGLSPPDLVLMDVQMPEMDGYEATRRIKALSPAAAILPIVALTANAMEGDRQQCLAAGMIDYVAKPFDPGGLIRTVDRWILKR